MMNQGAGGRRPTGSTRRGPGGTVGVLHVISGNDRGKQYPLVNASTAIGRGADQDFVLADIAVSRKHVVITVEGDRYRVRDLGSGNGTLVNGVKVTTGLLTDGDQIEIGNSLLRFDHPPSRAGAVPQPVSQAASSAPTMVADANYASGPASIQAPVAFPPPTATPIPPDAFSHQLATPPVETTPLPPARPAAATPILTAPKRKASPAAIGSPAKKYALVGGLAVAVAAGGALVARRVSSGGAQAEAQRLYSDGTRAFRDGDYDRAKQLFSDALRTAPDSPQTEKYLKQCDLELRAQTALKKAKSYARAKEWEDELKALDAVDKSTASFDDADRMRKEAVPQAVAGYLADARDALETDPDTAKQKLEAALLLDPDNAGAHELAEKLRSKGAHGTRPAAVAREESHPHHAAAVEEAPAPSHRTAAHHASDDDEDATPAPSGGGGGDLMSNHAALGPYRAKDFNGAASALRQAAQSLHGSAAQKAQSTAAQIGQLASAYQRAESSKGSNPVAAVQAYNQAMAIDASVSHGMHGAYFKAQVGKLAGQAAQAAFAQGKYDAAFDMAKAAQRATGSDGGVLAQLHQKAAELNVRANAMARANPNGAKALWRQVLRMVPPGDSTYVRATQGLSAASGAAKDEDED